MSENEEVAKLVDGAYKNILEKFNPCARQLISAGKAYLKALHGAVAASKAYIDALSKLARHAHQGTWGGCTDIGTALMQLVDVQKEIESQQLNILKAFYVDLLVPLESNIDKDTKIVACEQKRFLQQHKCLQESFLKAAATVKKQRKKNRTHRATNIEKEIKNIHVLEEEKMKLDCFCERSLKQAIIQERRRFGFVLERQCSLTKHNLVYHSQGQNLLQHRLEEWEDVAKSRESLPEPIDKLFPSTNNYKICGEYASANILGGPTPSSLCVPGVPQGGGGTLRKTRSIDASCMDLREAPNDPYPRPLTRAKSDFNIASSSASLVSDDYGNHRVTLRSKGLVDGDSNSVRIKVRALYSYLSSGEHQLSFHEGDTIALIGNRNKGWQYGENQRNHRCGWFPIAYTEALRDNCSIGNNLDGSSELKRHSMDFSKPYSNSVTRSKTTPNIQPYECGIDTTSSEYASSHSSPLSSDSLPPAPTVQRPLSTFIDSCAARHFESLQHLRLGPCPRLVHSTTGPTIGGTTSSAATPTSPTSGDPPLMSDALLRRFHPRQQKPSQHCPLLPQHPASLHSSNDSGFCNEPPSLPLPTTGLLKQLDQVDSARPKENIFSAVKLRKVVTNDRSAPMIS